jgi:hypothetical protein
MYNYTFSANPASRLHCLRALCICAIRDNAAFSLPVRLQALLAAAP